MIPSILVVLVSDNDQDTIYDSLMSASDQDYPNKEIFVIDNFSNDNSWSNIEQASKIVGPKATYNKIDKKHSHAELMNFSIKNVKSDIYAFLPGNVIWEKNKLNECVNVILQNPDIINFVYNDCYVSRDKVYFPRTSFNRNQAINIPFIVESFLVSQNNFNRIGNFDEKIKTAYSYDFLLRSSEVGLPLHIPKPLELIVPKTININEQKLGIQMSLKKLQQRMNA